MSFNEGGFEAKGTTYRRKRHDRHTALHLHRSGTKTPSPLEAILVDRATGRPALLLDTGQRLQRPYRARACSGR